jgi:hypothetical protein
MKKQKLPKYVQQLFKKPQFKIGDYVKYEFLGEHGWGHITKINEYNDKITYMVKTNKYTYPCGIQIKEYTSYYAGSIDIETSKNRSNNVKTRISTTETRINDQTRKRLSGLNSNSISNTGLKYESADDSRDGNGKNIETNTRSRKTIENVELEKEINKQKNFLRRFT